MFPVVAIVGRPNVGKSTLFNRLVGERQALVDDRPGVTRDRNTGFGEWMNREIMIIDTGGFEPDLAQLDEGDLFRAVRRQAELAIAEADVVLFVVDRKAGLTPADRLTAEILRKNLGSREGEERLLLVVNKCDSQDQEDEAAEFWELGIEPMVCISAEHGRGVYDLWDVVYPRLPPAPADEEEEEDGREVRIAILGRPNIGKSTLCNQLLGEERQVVHDMPGTTMDAVDTVLEISDERCYRIVDTAGIRRRSRIDDRLETAATLQAIRPIERCHVSLLMIDGRLGITSQDARLASLVVDRGRACILIINRWDEVLKMPDRDVHVVRDEIEQSLPHLSWAPALFTSALTGKGCHKIFDLVEQIYVEFNRRVPTAELNKFLEATIEAHSPPQKHHHPVRLNYMTQTRVRPPTFVVWSNSPEGVKPPYKRYMENRLREFYGFDGSPIRLHIRKKRRSWDSSDGR